jgi:hypothetical protein
MKRTKALMALGGMIALVGGTAAVVSATGGHQVEEDKVAAIAEHASDSQQEALADGEVSREEYEAAVAGTIACVQEAGIPVSEPDWDATTIELTFGGYDSKAEAQAAFEKYMDCYTENQQAIDRVWASQLAGPRPGPGEIAEFNERLQACTGAEEPTFVSITAALRASDDPEGLRSHCYAEAESALGWAQTSLQ